MSDRPPFVVVDGKLHMDELKPMTLSALSDVLGSIDISNAVGGPLISLDLSGANGKQTYCFDAEKFIVHPIGADGFIRVTEI